MFVSYSVQMLFTKTMQYRMFHDNGERPFRQNREKCEVLMKEHFWTFVKHQIRQSGIRNDRRVRFPGAEAVVKNAAKDLLRSNELSRNFGRSLKKPINTVMVMYAELPQPLFDGRKIRSLYMAQKRLRRVINDELMEFLIINSHLGWLDEDLKYDHPFWKFSDTAINAINELTYFLVAVNYEFDYTL